MLLSYRAPEVSLSIDIWSVGMLVRMTTYTCIPMYCYIGIAHPILFLVNHCNRLCSLGHNSYKFLPQPHLSVMKLMHNTRLPYLPYRDRHQNV